MIEKQPIEVFERMRDLMAELMFLTDTIEDEQFEGNPDVLEVIAEDYTQMFELAMSRGLVIEEDIDEDGVGLGIDQEAIEAMQIQRS